MPAFVPMLRATNVQGGLVLDNDLVYVPESVVAPAQLLRVGDIVVAASSGSVSVVGKSAMLKHEWHGAFGAFCTVLRTKPGIDAAYIGHYVASPAVRTRWSSLAAGTSINNLKRQHFEETVVPLPPVDEQRRIVAVIEEQLSRLDAGVVAVHRARVNLKRLHAAGLERLVTGTLGSPRILASQHRQPAPLPIPIGWEWHALADLCTSITDGDHQPPPKTDHGIPFIVIGNVRTGSVDFHDCRHVSPEYYRGLSATRQPKQGDVLYTLVGSFGIPVLVKKDEPFCVQRHIGILRPSARLLSAYLAAALGSRLAFQQASACATGTAQMTVPLAGLRRMVIPVPPLSEQVEIVARLEELESAAGATDGELVTASRLAVNLRSSILIAAFSGQLVPQSPTDVPSRR